MASRAAIVLAGSTLACACLMESEVTPLYGVAVVDDGGNRQVQDSGRDARPKEASVDAPADVAVDADDASNDAGVTDADAGD